jgi:hypothetical protein
MITLGEVRNFGVVDGAAPPPVALWYSEWTTSGWCDVDIIFADQNVGWPQTCALAS